MAGVSSCLDLHVLSGSELNKAVRRAVFTTAQAQVLLTSCQPCSNQEDVRSIYNMPRQQRNIKANFVRNSTWSLQKRRIGINSKIMSAMIDTA